LQAFWDWTWDQLADYDLPAVLQFIYNKTGGQKVHYIGHSLVIMHMALLFSIPSTWVLELGEDAETFALFSRGP
jgi:predicted alpha/beta hydrolase